MIAESRLNFKIKHDESTYKVHISNDIVPRFNSPWLSFFKKYIKTVNYTRDRTAEEVVQCIRDKEISQDGYRIVFICNSKFDVIFDFYVHSIIGSILCREKVLIGVRS